MTEQYIQKLDQLDQHLTAINYSLALIEWDSRTLASKKGGEERSITVGAISKIYFEAFINDSTKETLDYLNQHLAELDDIHQAKTIYFTKEYHKISKIPADEFAQYTALLEKSTEAWEEARTKDDFSIFAPYLDQVIKTLKKFIQYRGYTKHPYNTLLDDYEPGLTVAVADQFFTNLKTKIVPLVQAISQKPLPAAMPVATYPVDQQAAFSTYIMEQLGFDANRGTIAESAHPFTLNLSRNDVRITTHYYENDLPSSVFSTIHETGHALYEQNISDRFGFSQLTSGVSMGIHESQSRIYENNFGRDLAFWDRHYAKLQSLFPEQLGTLALADFFRAINIVRPSLIRIEADEVTYPLHIMVRYEMEKMIFSQEIDVYDLPRLWNEKYQQYLGLSADNNAQGILQDVHWSAGLFGYFPSYALGSAYAAQFAHHIGQSIDIKNCLATGDMKPLLGWLSQNVHTYGSSKTPAEIIHSATGQDFNPDYYTDYLDRKYSQIYEL